MCVRKHDGKGVTGRRCDGRMLQEKRRRSAHEGWLGSVQGGVHRFTVSYTACYRGVVGVREGGPQVCNKVHVCETFGVWKR